MGTLFALLSSALWGTSDFCGGTLSMRLSAVTVAVVSEFVGFVGVLVVAVAVGGFGADTGYVGWGLLGAVAGSVGIIAFYRALATGTMGIVAPIASLGVVVPVVAGIAGGDRPHALAGVGIVVAVVGVVLAGGPELASGSDDRAAAARPLWLAGLAAVSFGLVFIGLAHGARSSTVMTLLVMRGAAIVLMLAVALIGNPRQLRIETSDVPLLVVVGSFDVGANATFAYASRHGLLSLVAVLSSLYPAVTAVLARLVHEERLRRVQVVGVVGALAGVALIAAGGTT